MSNKKSHNKQGIYKEHKPEHQKAKISLAEINQRSQAERDERLLGRQIRNDFYELKHRGTSNISDLANFIAKYSEHLEIMKSALSDQKNQPDFFSQTIWLFLSGEEHSLLEHEILTQKLKNDRINWITNTLPTILEYQIPITTMGPDFRAVSQQELRNKISSTLGIKSDDIIIRGDFPFIREGRSPIQIEFSDGIIIDEPIELIFNREPLPETVKNLLAEGSIITIQGETNIEEQLRQHLSEESPHDIVHYYPILCNVLRSAYHYGYWKTAWIQNLYKDLQNRNDEYRSNLRILEIQRILIEINESEYLLSFEEDNDSLDAKRIEIIARERLHKKAKNIPDDIRLSCSEQYISDKPTISVKIFLGNIPVGKIDFQRASLFMPRSVMEEILEVDIPQLTQKLLDLDNNGRLLFAAEVETKHALDLPIEPDNDNGIKRATYLAGICSVLIKRGLVGDAQFKRTLTKYYAARGEELLDTNAIQARTYLLLFYRMIFQEGQSEDIKAIRPFEIPVLSNIFASYLSEGLRARKPKDTDIKGQRDLKQQLPLLWRASQLLNESHEDFFNALFEMYLIEKDFVRSLVKNLRKCGKIDRYDLSYLDLESSVNIIPGLVDFSLRYSTHIVQTINLVDFITVMLDIQDYAQPVISNIRNILESARSFVGSKDVVIRSTLHTDIDREYLQSKAALDRLQNEYRGNQDARRKVIRTLKLVNELKGYIDKLYRDFFNRAQLDVSIESATLPRNEPSPVEITVRNMESGLASNVTISIEKDSGFYMEKYTKSVDPYFAGERRVENITITPLTHRPIELMGQVKYTDQDGSKSTPIRQTLNVSDPEKFQYFKSPYIPGIPVKDTEMFFGRRKELEDIIHLLQGHYQDRVIAIHGQRRIGKTSLLYQLQKGDPNLLSIPSLKVIRDGYIPVFVDFERFTEKTEIWEIYYKIYSELHHQLTEEGITCPAMLNMTSFRDLPPDSVLEEFIYDINNCLKGSEKKILFLLDEFDNLIRIGGEEKGIFGALREIIIKYSDRLSFIFVGADQMVEMMNKHASRLYSMANILEIPSLNKEEAWKLITEPMLKINPLFEWPDNAVMLIINYTDGHPYFIQVICDGVVTKLIAGKRLKVTSFDVETVAQESATAPLAELSGVFKKMMDDILTPGKIVLTIIASLTKEERLERIWVKSDLIEQQLQPLTNRFPSALVNGVLRELEHKNILIHRGTSEAELEYAFRVPLLRLYVAEYLKLREVLREGEFV